PLRDELHDSRHVVQRDLAAEKRGGFVPGLPAGSATKVIKQQYEAFCVADVFGERPTAGRQASSEDAHGVGIRVSRFFSLAHKVAVDVAEVRAVLSVADRFESATKLPQPARIGRRRQYLGENGKAFLRDGGGRRPLPQKRADRLAQAVDRRAEM